MTRFRFVTLCLLVAMTTITSLMATKPAHANVSALVLSSRTCGTTNAFVTYDSFSEGIAPFYAVFSIDLNGNGVFGEADEPTRYVKLTPIGQAHAVGTTLRFNPVPEGSTITVTAYEIDSNGTRVSGELPPIPYACTHRPARDLLPPNEEVAILGVAVVAKAKYNGVIVYSEATTKSVAINGLGKGQLLNVIARNRRGDFIQVLFKGQPAWIMWQTQVLLFGPYQSLPILPNAEDAPASQ